MKQFNPALQVSPTPFSVLVHAKNQVCMDLQRTGAGAKEVFARGSVRKVPFGFYLVLSGRINFVFVVQENALSDLFAWFKWRIRRSTTPSETHRRTGRVVSKVGRN